MFARNVRLHAADNGFASSVYGLLPICKQIVLVTNQVRLLPYIRLRNGILVASRALMNIRSRVPSRPSGLGLRGPVD